MVPNFNTNEQYEDWLKSMLSQNFNMVVNGSQLCPKCGKLTSYMCSHFVCRDCCPIKENLKVKKDITVQ